MSTTLPGDDVIDPSRAAERYRRLAAVMTDRVAGVDPTGWDRPSPCEGWTARQVLAHVVEVQSWPLTDTGADVDDIPPAMTDPVGAWAAASSRLMALLDDPERAAVTIDVAVAGPMSAAAAVDLIVCGDLAVHTWDLSRATGQDEHMDPAEAARTRAQVEFIGDDTLRNPGLYRAALTPPDDADVQTRLLAHLGRQAW